MMGCSRGGPDQGDQSLPLLVYRDRGDVVIGCIQVCLRSFIPALYSRRAPLFLTGIPPHSVLVARAVLRRCRSESHRAHSMRIGGWGH